MPMDLHIKDVSVQALEEMANEVRKEILILCERSGTGHIGSAFSLVEIVVVLYNCIIKGNVVDSDRDRLILSKGHAVSALVAVLFKKGWISPEQYNSFALNGTKIGHHVHLQNSIGFDANTGSLGHGLSIGAGIALNCKKKKLNYDTYVILSDGELNEGAVWEAASFSAHHKLNNLCVIIDANGMQALGFTKDVVDPLNMKRKWEAFGWNSCEVEGHSIPNLLKILTKKDTALPTAVIAHTIKGFGVSFMQNSLLWHYRVPTGDEFKNAMKELNK